MILMTLPVSAAEGAKAGLPQLDTTYFPAQLFWLVITFVALYALMAYVALPGVQRTLEARQKVLSADLAAAEAANDQAKAMMAQYEKALSEARMQAQATISTMTAAAQKDAAERQAQQHRDLSQRLQDAEAKIVAARNEAINNLESMVQELSSAMVDKILGPKIKTERLNEQGTGKP